MNDDHVAGLVYCLEPVPHGILSEPAADDKLHDLAEVVRLEDLLLYERQIPVVYHQIDAVDRSALLEDLQCVHKDGFVVEEKKLFAGGRTHALTRTAGKDYRQSSHTTSHALRSCSLRENRVLSPPAP